MILTAKNISFSYRNKPILQQVNLNIKSGELLMITGPNGAGKSTLLSLLANENQLEDGSIYFKKVLLENWEDVELAHHKAKFSQEHNPSIGLPVKDIVLMGRYPYFSSTPHKKDLEIIDQVMQKTAVFKYRERSYNSLSGGEKQRVHLARVLAQLQNDIQDKLAFFDEPLNNLDVRHQHNILEEIQAFVDKGNSAVVVLHDLNMAAEFADKVLLLKKGKIIAHGNPKEIFTEKIINSAYDFPCAVCVNPITNCPMIIFGNKTKEKEASKLNYHYF